MLASRGMAVLQPQFRGSDGLGERFERAGYGQWGRAMQDDVSAGARWLVREGIADPARLCIYGSSYGGYAAMWGMASTPALYRCGISHAGVSDLALMFKDDSDVSRRATGRLYQQRVIGDPRSRAQDFDAVSPLKKAASIQGPVLIAHGLRDVRVPIVHARRLVTALREAGKPVESLEFVDEGHGLHTDANRQRFHGAVFDFLDRHIGTRAAASTAPASAAR